MQWVTFLFLIIFHAKIPTFYSLICNCLWVLYDWLTHKKKCTFRSATWHGPIVTILEPTAHWTKTTCWCKLCFCWYRNSQWHWSPVRKSNMCLNLYCETHFTVKILFLTNCHILNATTFGYIFRFVKFNLNHARLKLIYVTSCRWTLSECSDNLNTLKNISDD